MTTSGPRPSNRTGPRAGFGHTRGRTIADAPGASVVFTSSVARNTGGSSGVVLPPRSTASTRHHVGRLGRAGVEPIHGSSE